MCVTNANHAWIEFNDHRQTRKRKLLQFHWQSIFFLNDIRKQLLHAYSIASCWSRSKTVLGHRETSSPAFSETTNKSPGKESRLGKSELKFLLAWLHLISLFTRLDDSSHSVDLVEIPLRLRNGIHHAMSCSKQMTREGEEEVNILLRHQWATNRRVSMKMVIYLLWRLKLK